MSTVPWIRLYQNWPRHRKTMALRKALGTAEPILCLWLWAAENADDGDLSGMTTKEIEEAAGWTGKRGKAMAAMVEVGFIDMEPESDGMRIHNWQRRAGAGVANLERRREKARERMRLVRANGMRTECEHGGEQGANAVGANKARTLSLSLDLGSSSLSADPDPERACSNDGAKSAHDWCEFFKARHRVKTGRFYGHGSADMKALGSLADLLATLPDAQRADDWESRERIVGEFLARTDARTQASGWSFSFFVQDFRGLAIPPEQRPASPPVPAPPRKDIRIGSVPAERHPNAPIGRQDDF